MGHEYDPSKADYTVKDCKECQDHIGQFWPRHEKSPWCESKSGPHCTCDMCW